MTSVQHALDIAVQLAFVALALFTLADWIRRRDRQRAWLVGALVSLSGLAVGAPVAPAIGLKGRVVGAGSLLLFIVSGFALLMFRDSLIPLGARVRASITAAIAVV